MTVRQLRRLCLAGVIVSLLMFGITLRNSLGWIDKSFPGFMVMANSVVASISLPDWPDPSAIFQHQIRAVDGQRVSSSEEIYAHAASREVGSLVTYTVRAPNGDEKDIQFRVRRFTQGDYALLYGAFLINGFAFLCIGFVVFYLKPSSRAARGLLATSLCTGVFVTTAVDLYGPHWFFRLHVAAEGMAAAAFAHLALTFPTNRLRDHYYRNLFAIYAPFTVLMILYQLVIWDPKLYTAIHLIASGGFGICTIGIILSILFDLITSKSVLVRRRLAVVALGSVGGVLPTTLLWAFSGITGGQVPVNAAAMTAFLFPLGISYAIVKQDLFEIDTILRRALTYAFVMLAISTAYFLVLFLFGVLVPGRALLLRSPVTLALLNLGLLFSIAPLRDQAQNIIDRTFFRQRYDSEEGLSQLSQRLASARALDRVGAHTVEVMEATVSPQSVALYLQSSGEPFLPVFGGGGPLTLPTALAERLRRGEHLARYEFDDDETEESVRHLWRRIEGDVLLPLRADGAPLGVIILGQKNSGRAYSSHDMSFLDTAANQISLAVANALAFDRLEHLNENLEEQVIERTAKLNEANSELNNSLAKLRGAYDELQKRQDGLLRADRLATLGRLTAGLAHEINTPLGAVLNALKTLSELGDEYEASIDDTSVLPEDHHEIAKEIASTSRAAMEWGQRAAAYVRSVKLHGRENRAGQADRFRVAAVVENAKSLVEHRLRTASCQLLIADCDPNVELSGDPGRLGQVLVNLITNAIDAYEEQAIPGKVEVSVQADPSGKVGVQVSDHAGGIPANILPKIFDELYTTKEAGRGTGLGLWIARNIIEEGFGGTLDVTVEGDGSRFVATMPVAATAAETEAGNASKAA